MLEVIDRDIQGYALQLQILCFALRARTVISGAAGGGVIVPQDFQSSNAIGKTLPYFWSSMSRVWREVNYCLLDR